MVSWKLQLCSLAVTLKTNYSSKTVIPLYIIGWREKIYSLISRIRKARLIQVWRQNYLLYQFLNIARPYIFHYIHSEGILWWFLAPKKYFDTLKKMLETLASFSCFWTFVSCVKTFQRVWTSVEHGQSLSVVILESTQTSLTGKILWL